MVMDIFVITIILLILWTFWSGFTDASNSITTVVATRVLTPLKAVCLASIGNFLGILLGSAVAVTMGKGIVDPKIVSGELVIAALIGGMLWDVITYIKGLPISESQVLVGSLIGAGIASSGLKIVFFGSLATKVLIPMTLAPIAAFIFSLFFVGGLVRIFRGFTAAIINRVFGKLQILSSLFFSISHGSNDAMKTAGVIFALMIFYNKISPEAAIPLWIKLVSVLALSLGTFFGGWRVVKTMGFKLTRLKPWQGFSAETGAAIVVGTASQLGFPLSTTQTVSGSIMGVGFAKGSYSVRKKVALNVFLAWILTIPMSALFSFLVYSFMKYLIL